MACCIDGNDVAGMTPATDPISPHLPPFANRHAAGFELAAKLDHLKDQHPVVLALPRGGVPVAAPVAADLGVPLDVFLVRKVGVPWDRELGVGAVAEGGAVEIDEGMARQLGLSMERLAPIVAAEVTELERRLRLYRGEHHLPDLHGRVVVLIDDGIATGGSARAAIRAVRARGAARVVLAAPVATLAAIESLRAEADEVVVLLTPPELRAVSDAYESFEQVSDREVTETLASHRRPAHHARTVLFVDELPS